MSYGQCLKCPAAVAAWQLTAGGLAAVPEAELLCLEHLQDLLSGRRHREIEAEREKLRRYCECGRELFFRAVQRDAVGDPCEWCKLGRPVTVDVPVGNTLNPRQMGEHYIVGRCHEDGCDVKMVWLLPSGIIACTKHGAGPATEDAHP